MQSGNGIDIAAIYQLLREVADRVASHDRRFDQIDGRFEAIDSKLGKVTADIAGLREAVTNYHATVLGRPANQRA